MGITIGPAQQQDALFDIEDIAVRAEALRRNLIDDYVVPPFSVLDTRSGYWRARRRLWLGLGIQSEMGRGSKLTYNLAINATADNQWAPDGSTSVFDPVLCEIVYRWFGREGGGTVLDPFAGGSVRAIVGATLGHTYTGVDLRAEQVAANLEQWAPLKGAGPDPTWTVGDSELILPTIRDPYDLVFTCPPYYDLEVYSDLPGDLSNAPSYEAFLEAYSGIIFESVRLSRGFVAWVVGDIRDPRGNYRGLVSDTIRAFRAAGGALYNEAILLNALGTAAVRADGQFKNARKLVRVHQHLLVFRSA